MFGRHKANKQLKLWNMKSIKLLKNTLLSVVIGSVRVLGVALTALFKNTCCILVFLGSTRIQKL